MRALSRWVAGLSALGLLASFPADANLPPEDVLTSAPSLLERSTVVLVGRVESVPAEPAGPVLEPAYGRVKVLYVLKGDPPGSIEVLMIDTSAETDPHCCLPGRRYLMFLNPGPDKIHLFSRSGSRGFYLLEH